MIDVCVRKSAALLKYGIVAADSRTINDLYSPVEKFPKWKEPILILGERGSGKELMAKFIKENGPYKYTKKDIEIDLRFGLDLSRPEKRNPPEESQVNFMDLATTIEEIVNR